MIDINELRDRAVTFGSDYLTDEEWVEVIDRLEAAEKERESWKGLAQQFGNELDSVRFSLERRQDELNRLRANMESAEKERDTLRTKIEAMEKQEPVDWQSRSRPTWNDGTWGQWSKCSEEYAQDIKKTPLLHDWLYEARALYALPGAKGE